VLKDGRFFFWGGVDALSRLHEDPATFPGIPDDILLYDPVKDMWSFLKRETDFPARVTLPVVFWKDQWIFISGEVRPGVRTNMITALKR
jgi:N-acetylneuraminic acid mutarotase